MIYTLENILRASIESNPLKLSRNIRAEDAWARYTVLEEITVKLSDDRLVTIPKDYQTDLSSVPRLFWTILSPDGDFALGAIIHDYLYEHKITSRKFADNEMLKWSKALNSTRKISIKNWDNYTRFIFVRMFGWYVWNN